MEASSAWSSTPSDLKVGHIIQPNPGLAGQKHSPFDCVLQLANISRPVVLQQSIHNSGGHTIDPFSVSFAANAEEMPSKNFNVTGSVS
jgi:hypothetical protein